MTFIKYFKIDLGKRNNNGHGALLDAQLAQLCIIDAVIIDWSILIQATLKNLNLIMLKELIVNLCYEKLKYIN